MVAIYVRQSVEKKDSISIEDQIDRCKKQLGEGEPYRIYEDRGASGKNTDRPAFRRLMADIRSRAVTKIVVYKLDRISRSVLDFSAMYRVWQEYGIDFCSCSEWFDTASPNGRAMLQISMVFAELERATILERVTDNYYARAREGFYLGGAAPFGFRKVGVLHRGKNTSAYAPDEETAPILRWAYEEYGGTAITLGKLARQLTERGARTTRNDTWTASGLARVLRSAANVRADGRVYNYLRGKNAVMNNPIEDYAGVNGCYVYAPRGSTTTRKYTDLSTSYVTLAPHRGIIPPGLWLRCQRKLDANSQVTSSGTGRHTWLSGLLKCGYCQYSLTVVNNNRGNRYINCYGRKKHICSGRKRAIRLEDIEGVVERLLLRHLERYRGIEARVEETAPAPERAALQQEIALLEHQIRLLLDDLLEAGASPALRGRIKAKIEALEAGQARKRAQLAEMLQTAGAQRIGGFGVEELLLGWPGFGLEVRREIAGIFLERVIVTDDAIALFYR